ncbi:MAG: sulfurtransferase TusA family protein [Eubacteriales bacterium]|nr:sulfurtransferase TusA family protein [Eubacteriales bacterium]
MKQVDARGCACPEPVVLTRNAVKEDPSGAEVLVDNACAVENISRFARNSGYQVAVQKNGDDIKLTLKKQ